MRVRVCVRARAFVHASEKHDEIGQAERNAMTKRVRRLCRLVAIAFELRIAAASAEIADILR